MLDEARPFPPTAHKLRLARARGEVAQTALLGAAVSTTAIASYFALTAEETIGALGALTRTLIAPSAFENPDPRWALERAFDTLFEILAWPLALSLALSILASFVQVGPLFSTKAFEFDLSRLSPARGLSRLFDPTGMVERSLGALAVFALLALALSVFVDAVPGLAGRTALEPITAARATGTVLGAYAVRAAAILSALAASAFVYRRHRYQREQSMSHRERERERRELEGDPATRRQQRTIAREILAAMPLEEALSGDFVLIYGSRDAVIVRWTDRSEAPRIERFVSGVLRDRAIDLASSGSTTSLATLVNDDALVEALRTVGEGRRVPRRLWKPIAPLFASRE